MTYSRAGRYVIWVHYIWEASNMYTSNRNTVDIDVRDWYMNTLSTRHGVVNPHGNRQVPNSIKHPATYHHRRTRALTQQISKHLVRDQSEFPMPNAIFPWYFVPIRLLRRVCSSVAEGGAYVSDKIFPRGLPTWGLQKETQQPRSSTNIAKNERCSTNPNMLVSDK